MSGFRKILDRIGVWLRRLSAGGWGGIFRPVPAPRPVVPREFAGRWIAWSADGRRIVASGASLAEVRDRAALITSERVAFERLGMVPTREAARSAR